MASDLVEIPDVSLALIPCMSSAGSPALVAWRIGCVVLVIATCGDCRKMSPWLFGPHDGQISTWVGWWVRSLVWVECNAHLCQGRRRQQLVLRRGVWLRTGCSVSRGQYGGKVAHLGMEW